jgi:succinyl-diaminopimelate desuccinylase
MTVVDDRIYGRGVCDMKGAVACMIAALENYTGDHRVSLLIASDEEGIGYSIKNMLQWMDSMHYSIDFAVVGEPTSQDVMGDTIKIGRRGSVNFVLGVYGKQGHVAYPDQNGTLNAAHAIARIVNNLSTLSFDDGSENFQPSHLEVTRINVDNAASNVVPGHASAIFNVRFNDKIALGDLVVSVRKSVEDCGDYFSHYDLQYSCSAFPFLIKSEVYRANFMELVSEICHIQPIFSTSGGTSDARFVQGYCPLVEFGVLNATAHQIDENIKNSDLQMLYDVYYQWIDRFHAE